MSDIRYVCLSDLHLGADNSILTSIKPNSIETDPMLTSPVLSQLVACLRELITQNESKEKPTLILNGDILELALAETNVAAMVFERFIELIFPRAGEALFDKNILYIPGNHDHHIWENGRETQYVEFISSIPAGTALEIPWHTTKIRPPNLVRGYFLTDLIQRYPHLKDAVISILYPNFALLSTDGQKSIIFSHGHYVESIYSLMSTLNTLLFPNRQEPKVIYDLEAENFAWIDFFWSTMGRSGDVGTDIGLLYDKLQDEKQVDRLLGNLSHGLVEKYHQPRLLEGVEAKVLQWFLGLTIGNIGIQERRQTGELLSPDAQHGLQWYLEGPLREQLLIEDQQHILETDSTFIFGHTHKPFSQDMNFSGFNPWMKVYNSGGWVVDSVKPSPIHGGAVILIDEALHVTSLRMYNEAASVEEYFIRVEESTHPGAAGSNPFYERVNTLVKPSNEPWKSFTEAVAGAVAIHAKVLQTKINL